MSISVPTKSVLCSAREGWARSIARRDPRLGRDVAIKVLPANASSDPGRLQRFEQEARAAAALNHPNILAVYDVGVHDGVPYLVSELLDGQTLRDRLSERALPLRTRARLRAFRSHTASPPLTRRASSIAT